MKNFKILTLFVLLGFLFVFPLASEAMTKDKETGNIYVGSDEVIDYNITEAGNLIDINGVINGDIWVAGAEIMINAEVKGDIFAAGNNITISGPVQGNVSAAGSNVLIESEVGGSVRLAGSNIKIKNKVSKNIYAFGSNVKIEQQAETGMHARLAGNFVNILGKINGNLDVDGSKVILNSQVDGSVNANLGQAGTFLLEESALVKGDVIYSSEEDLKLKEGALIEGETVKKAPEVRVIKEKFWTKGFFFKRIISLFSLLVLGLILVSLLRKKVLEVTKRMLKKPGASLGWGIVFSIVIPVVSFFLLFTLIGLPLAFIVMALYIIALYIAKVFAGIALGYWLMKYFVERKKLQPAKGEVNLMWAMVLGIVVLFILISIPFVGWLIKFLAVWWAFGALLEIEKQAIAQWK